MHYLRVQTILVQYDFYEENQVARLKPRESETHFVQEVSGTEITSYFNQFQSLKFETYAALSKVTLNLSEYSIQIFLL